MFTLKHFILFTKPLNALKDQLSLKDRLARAGKGFGFLWFKYQSWNITKLNYYQIIRVWLTLSFIRRQMNSDWLAPNCWQYPSRYYGRDRRDKYPEGSVCIISMQLPEYPQPMYMPKEVGIVFTNLDLILCQSIDSIKDGKFHTC